MNPLSLKATNYRTFDSLELDLPDGCLAVVGDNGAGKSSIVNVIDLALFGPESRSLGDYLAEDAAGTELELELTFEHAGQTYRVRRGFSAKGRGKTTLDFEWDSGGWMPLTRETQKATQEAIEETLGLSRETFRASAFLAQGDGAAFTEAVPRDRKRILSQVLGLHVWERLFEAVGSDRRHTERLLAELGGRIAHIEATGGPSMLAELEETVSRLRARSSELEREHATRQRMLDDAADAVRDAERAEATFRERRAAYDAARARLDEHARIAEEAVDAAESAEALRAEIAALATALDVQQAILEEQRTRDVVANTEALIREYDAKREAHAAAVYRRSDLLGRASAKSEEAQALREQADHALEHVGEARCDVCGQLLGHEAAEATAKRLREQAETFDFTAHELDREAAAIDIPVLGDEPRRDLMSDTEWQAAQARLERCRNDYAKRLQLEERLAGHERTIARARTPEYRLELDARKQAALDAAAALDEIGEPEPGALDDLRVQAIRAKGAVDELAREVRESREAAVRAESSLEQAQTLAAELQTAIAEQEELRGELDLLSLLERAYGRDGIPALIVETSAIPQVEAEANRILAELGTPYRVELRTQRALKSGDGLSDTLDVVVIGELGARDYSTFSGGERSRLNVALRIALARLLAHRRGAESRVLVLDEVEYLDQAGQLALARILQGLAATEFDKVVLVSHADALRDVFDNVIAVEKVDGRSRLAA